MFEYNGSGLSYLGNNPLVWVDLVISFLVICAIAYVLVKIIKRRFAYILSIVSILLIVVAWLFSLKLLWGISLAGSIVLISSILVVNQSEIRPVVANSLAGQYSLLHHKATEKVFDRHALYQKVAIAVESLSKNKIGAIITFEKNTQLTDFVKSGTILDAPVTPELLLTIFYPGTRLHDGAVVIHRDKILAASVYYTPTTKPLTGKFGSRHRAAIGISEVTDSVTIVVSEETGRISLAIAGELMHVSADNFIRTFEDYMFVDDTKEENSK